MRKLQAGTSSLLLTDDYHDGEGTGEYKADVDDDTQQDAALVTVAPPATKSLSPEALHIMQQLESSGFEGTPCEEPDEKHSLIDHLPLSNFMTEAADADEVLTTRVGRRHYNTDAISQIVGGVVEQLVKAQWDSCASACFESSMANCDPNSFVALVKKILTADGGCYSDGMAWRRYRIPVDEAWTNLGAAYGHDLRQFDALTFAMPPLVASKFPTPVSVVAVPVAKGILIKTTIKAGYTDDDTIMLRQHPELICKLHHKVNGLPYAALVDDNTVRRRGLRMGSPFDLLPYIDDMAMEMLPTQWKYHDPGNTYLGIGTLPNNALH